MTTMRAAQFDAYGAPEVLHVAEVPRPEPGPGQLLVRVEAAGINPHDLFTRSGTLKLISGRKFPLGTGIDFAGEVVATGAGADLVVGQPVWGSLPAMKPHSTGAIADYVVTGADRVGVRPAGLTAVEAASLVVTGTTALRALQDIAGTTAGRRVLIRGAAGGVGLAAVQIAAALRAEVSTLSSRKDHEALRELGAAHTLDYRETALDGLGRFDVVLDTVGTHLLALRRHLTGRGRMVTIAFTSATAFAEIGASAVHGPRRVRAFSSDAKRDLLDRVRALVDAGSLRPVVASTFDIGDIAAAHVAQQAGGERGKRIVTTAGA
jgi:NADPH:quinone reductase-like Zn-dependent oxidoreductase